MSCSSIWPWTVYNNLMNTETQRPDPDALLERIQAEEDRRSSGRLKIFLGYVAGVGKTFAMLEAAHQRLKEGVDVVAGYVETHARKETDALLAGLEVVPRRQVEYHGALLGELDLDAVLARRPALVLVDELAHTNAPGLRHPKRFLDVEEILRAGIDVYTTLNIQHLESLNDVVRQITGVTVRETVPDRIVDEAFEIEIIDLPTGELLQRLKEGKVYIPDQAVRALEHFFRQGNLTALRELSLRRAAARVDNQMIDYMHTRSIPGPWPASQRIMVCISSHPMGERLIRAGRRLADDMGAEWTVLFVETPGHLKMPAENSQRIQRNLRLAEELGARVVSITSENVAATVIDFAREQNITKIIAGKPLRPRWIELVRGTVIDQIIRQSGGIDVYVVSEGAEELRRAWRLNFPNPFTPHRPLGRYLASIGLVALFSGLVWLLFPFLAPTNLAMIYLVAVILAAIFLGRGPSIVASVLSVLTFDFFFVEPRFTFSVNDTQYVLTFIALLLVGLIISNSAALLRDQVVALRRRQLQSTILNNLGRELTAAITLEQVLQTVIRNVSEIFNREVVIFLPEGEQLVVKASSPEFQIDASEIAVADWAYKNNRAAGRGTDTLPSAAIRYTPLVTVRGTIGVLGAKPQDVQHHLSEDQRSLLESVVNLAALAIERASFAQNAAQAETLRNTEKLQSALLNSISHELRTPLAAITGVLTTLGESARGGAEERLEPGVALELVDAATRQAQRLNRLVGNLLDMTRLEAGALRLNRQPLDLQDLIATITADPSAGLAMHPLQTQVPDDLPLVQADAVLMGQVLVNLLDNAGKFSPPQTPVRISARVAGEEVIISVADEGIGIPPADLERVFDKFYRVVDSAHADQASGTGLGLSICKGIVESHGGRIWAQNNPERGEAPYQGVTVSFSLPLDPGDRHG
jgi:two-component system sensor histidine kinase KdpD